MLENAGILVHRVSTEPHSFNFLLFDRADFTLIDKRVGWHVLKQKLPNKAEQFTSQSNQYIQGTYFLMVSKVYPNSEQHLHYFNSKLKELKSSGVYDNILRIYGQ
jgi:ABC-type amino acid transport substrate-binding protein